MEDIVESVLIPKDEYESLLEKVSESQDENPSSDKEVECSSEILNECHEQGQDSSVIISAKKPSLKDNVKDIEADNNSNNNNNNNENNVPKSVNSIQLLLVKTPTSIKHHVKSLAEYIKQYGEGIIEWDDSLRFMYFQQVIPKTNVVNLISHALGQTSKTPKAYTVFDRALKSIGIMSASDWILSKKVAEEEGKTTNTDNNNNNNNNIKCSKRAKRGKKRCNSVDYLDTGHVFNGANIYNPKGDSRRTNNKQTRFKKLKLNWVPY